MSSQVKKITYVGIFTALSVAVSLLESFFPMPIPGLKLGIANVVTVFVLYSLGAKEAYLILACRCIICSVLFGNVTSFAFSFAGGLMSLSVSAIIKRYAKEKFSFIGVCILGATAHNTAQTAVCSLMLSSAVPMFSYLPMLLIGSVVCGAVTGCILNFIPKGLFYHGKA